jgi:hypothetical protein
MDVAIDGKLFSVLNFGRFATIPRLSRLENRRTVRSERGRRRAAASGPEDEIG